ncbi:MAG: response regulator [bacterium]|nr:response regulator [bacterium]
MSSSLKDVKLLVADDDYNNVEVIITILKNQTDQIFYAPNGQVAYDLAKKQQPDLILMDWQMPKVNGIEAIKMLQADESTKDIPVIVATGVMTTSDNLQEALEAGAVDFLRKPFSPIEFRARSSSTLRIKRQHDQIQEMLLKEKQYIEETLAMKERELSSMAIFDFQKNTLMEQLMEQVNRLDRITNHVYATDIRSIEKQIKSQLDLGKSWDTFKVHFEKMHDGFFATLDSKYPSLSINDRKLCAYVKMGMGNFEITQMTGSSDVALKKAINRLKKKLELGAEDDFRKFIFDF